jgi:hypothetical protein
MTNRDIGMVGAILPFDKNKLSECFNSDTVLKSFNKNKRIYHNEDNTAWSRVRNFFIDTRYLDYDIKFIENYIKPETTLNLLKTSYMIYQEVADEAIKKGEVDGIYIRYREYPEQSSIINCMEFWTRSLKDKDREESLTENATDLILHHRSATLDAFISGEPLLICKVPKFIEHMK